MTYYYSSLNLSKDLLHAVQIFVRQRPACFWYVYFQGLSLSEDLFHAEQIFAG